MTTMKRFTYTLTIHSTHKNKNEYLSQFHFRGIGKTCTFLKAILEQAKQEEMILNCVTTIHK